jgi:hypothetical protein
MGQARIPAGLDRQGSQQDFWKGNARCWWEVGIGAGWSQSTMFYSTRQTCVHILHCYLLSELFYSSKCCNNKSNSTRLLRSINRVMLTKCPIQCLSPTRSTRFL